MFIKKIIPTTVLLALFGVTVSGCNGTIDLTMYPDNYSAPETTATENIPAVAQTTQEITSETTPETTAPEPVYGYDFTSSLASMCYDATNDEIIYAKNAGMRVFPASTTKLLTALTAVAYTSSEHIYYVGSEVDMVAYDSSMSWIIKGESFYRDDILAAMLTPSGNDAAYCIAVNVAREVYGSNLTNEEAVEKFCQLMTDYAKKLGCTGTNFVTPDGYHDPEHYTTAKDMAIISKAAVECEPIVNITSQKLVTVYSIEGDVHSWENGNGLFYDPYIEYNVLGLKTGFTDEAGFCFIGAAEKDGKTIITLTFDCDIEYRYADTLKLMDLGFGDYDPDKEYEGYY